MPALTFKLRAMSGGALEVAVNDGAPLTLSLGQVPTFLDTVPDANLREVLRRMVAAARADEGVWQTLSTEPERAP